jgi:hypothetical protein
MPKDRGSKFLPNCITFVSNYVAAYYRRKPTSNTVKFIKTPEL